MPDLHSELLGRELAPSEPLNCSDLAKLLLNDTCQRIIDLKDNVYDKINDENKHVKDMIHVVIESLCKRLDKLESYVIKMITELGTKSEDFDLRLRTFNSYNEGLLRSAIFKLNDSNPKQIYF